MIKMSYEQIVAKIKEKTGITDSEIEQRVKQKMDQLAGLVSRDGAAHIIANEVGVNAFEDVTGKVKLDKLLPGMRNVETLGKVKAVYDVKEFSNAKGSGKVGSFLIADETGLSRVTCWHAATDKIAGLKTDDIVKVKNAYVRDNNGRAELHLNDKSEMEINPPGETVTAIERTAQAPVQAQRKKISELAESDQNVEIFGTLLQVFDLRFYEICPECGKRVKQRDGQFACDTHNTITPDYSYVTNAVIDDGSETIRAVFFREQAEQLIKKPREEIKQYREFKEKFDSVKTELLGQMIKLTGRVTKNTMFDRMEITARTVNMNPDPEEEKKLLNKQLGNETTA